MKKSLVTMVIASMMYAQTFIPVNGSVNRIVEGNGFVLATTSQGVYAIQGTTIVWSRNYGGKTYAARDSSFIYLLEPNGRLLKINPDNLNDTTVLAENSNFKEIKGVGNTLLFIQSSTGSPTYLYALNKNSGITEWNFTFNGHEYAGVPVIFGDTIYMGGSAGILKAIADGNVLWSSSPTGCYVHSRSADSSYVYFTDACGYLNAVDRHTGELLYSTNLGFGWITSMTIDDTLGYLADWDGTAICVNIINGNVVWSTDICGGVNQPPYIGENYVYYSCFNDHIYVLDKYTGNIINDLNAHTGIAWSPYFIITPSGLYVNGENAVVKFDVNDHISNGFWPYVMHDNWWTSNFNISGHGDVTNNVISVSSAFGIPGGDLTISIFLSNRNPVSGIQTTIVYDTSLLHFQNAELDTSIDNYSLSYEPRNDSIVLLLTSLSGDSILPGSTDVCFINFIIDSNATLGDSTSLELTGTVLSDPSGNHLQVVSEGAWVYIIRGIKGDLNQDGVVDVTDVIREINIILGKPPTPTQYEKWAGDMNDDGFIDVTDVVKIINVILGSGKEDSAESSGRAEIWIEGNKVFVDNDCNIAGIQFDIVGSVRNVRPGENMRRLSIYIKKIANGYRVLLVGINGATLSPGRSEIVKIEGKGSIQNLVVSDKSGRKVDAKLKKIAGAKVYFVIPNPVRSEGYLRFLLPEKARVKVEMFDVVGRKVREIVSREFEAGIYDVKIDVKDLSAGVYFIQAEISGVVYNRRFIVKK